jgi:hypothetical protein
MGEDKRMSSETKEVEVVVTVTVPATADEDQVVANVQSAARKVPGAVDAGVRHMKALKLSGLLFLWNEVHLTGDTIRGIDPGHVFGGMTCNEAQSLADIFAAAGDQKTHDHIMESHAHGDDDEEDEHHAQYLEIQKNGGSL